MQNATLAMLLFALLFSACNNKISDQDTAIRSGAKEALDLLGDMRAYPNKDIPSDGYYKAYVKMEREIKRPDISRAPSDWEPIGPWNIAGRSLCVAINPQNNKTIFTGTASGGLWKSYNQGQGVSWERVPLGYPALGIGAIEFAPGDSSVMYLATGEVYNFDGAGNGAAYRPTRGTYGIGILKSIDAGATWTKSLDWSYESQRGVWQVKVAPSNANIVYAATTHGTYKSTDAGATWNQVLDVVMGMDLVVHPTNENIVFVGCGNLNSEGKGLYRTLDGGANWTKAGGPLPSSFGGKIMLDMAPSDPDYIYASIGNSSNTVDGHSWLCRSTDGGDTWEIRSEFDYSKWQGWFSHDVAVNPTNREQVSVIGITIWKSTDGGANLKEESFGGVAFGTPPIGMPDGPSGFTHSDHHDVIFDPADPGRVYYANDGGVYVSLDNGETFASANGGLQTTQFYNGISVAQNGAGMVMGGLQDNSTVQYSGSKAWNRVIGGDGSWTAMHPTNPVVNYGSAQNLTVLRTFDNSYYEPLFIEDYFLGNDNISSFIAPFVLAPSEPDRLYAAAAGVYKTDNAGNSWVPINNGQLLNGAPALSMDVATTDKDIMMVATAPLGTQRPEIFITQNGSTFTNITQDLPDRYINDITIDPTEVSRAYITLGGFGSPHLYRTTDSGASWENISGNLPDVPTNAVVIDPENTNFIYVGNDLGVFFKSLTDNMDWVKLDQGIIDGNLCMDLKIDPVNRKLYNGTHGSGMFEIDLLEDISIPTNDITQKRLNIYPVPSSSDINIDIEDISLDSQYRIIDIQGRTIVNKTNIHTSRTLTINIEELAQGTYFLEIVNKKDRRVGEFVKN